MTFGLLILWLMIVRTSKLEPFALPGCARYQRAKRLRWRCGAGYRRCPLSRIGHCRTSNAADQKTQPQNLEDHQLPYQNGHPQTLPHLAPCQTRKYSNPISVITI